MTQSGRPLFPSERRAARQPTPSDRAVREVLRRPSPDEVEAQESALMAREAGGPLDAAREAALAGWERVAPQDPA